MVAGGRVVWARRRPRRAAGRLGWTAFLAGFVCGPAWLLFAGETSLADGGAVNPLALVVPSLAVVFSLVLAPQVLALVRRPVVSADHYALAVRPGVGRTLVLPWVQLAELAIIEIDDDSFLLVRCSPKLGRLGDRPRWWDQAHLRTARRFAPAVAAYDLAIAMDAFAGTPHGLLTELARYVPGHVTIVSRTPR